jgi:hypothetical protein
VCTMACPPWLRVGLMVALTGCGSTAYECQQDTQCQDEGRQGMCQPTGFCSFPDDTCASGQRYGKLAGMGLAETCVPEAPDHADGTGATSSADTDTGLDTGADDDTTVASDDSDGSDGGSCVPDCSGKQCGPDGCGAECGPGCEAQEQCSAAGTCEPDCASTWKSLTGDMALAVVLGPSERLFVTGESEDQMWVGALSTCTGALEQWASVSPPDEAWSRAMALDVSGDDIYLLGHGEPLAGSKRAVAARVDASTFTQHWVVPLGEEGAEEGWGIGVAHDGSVWMAGTSSEGDQGIPWVLKGDAEGNACGFPPVSGSGNTRRLVTTSDGIYVGGARDQRAFVSKFDLSACGCDCEPVWTIDDTDLESTYTEARGIAITDEAIYVGGAMNIGEDSSDVGPFVAKFDIVTRQVIGAWLWNPTDEVDLLLDLAVDDDTVYAAVTAGYDAATPETAVAYLVALPAALPFEATPAWTTELPFINAAWGVTTDADAVYVVGRTASSGWAARCTKDGVCPQ